MGIWVLLLIRCFILPAQADSCEADVYALAPAFLEVNENTYRPLMCSDTAFAWVERLKQDAVDLSQASVVVLRHKGAPYLPLRPLQPRLRFKDTVYTSANWAFHVFFVKDGMVYDFDNSDRLQAVGLEVYMRSMWSEDELDNYLAQVKSAEQFAKADLNGTFTNAPLIPATAILTTVATASCSNRSPVLVEPWYAFNH